MRKMIAVMALVCVPGLAMGAPGDVLYSSGMDDGTGWAVNATGEYEANFGWDFTTMGIPASPGGSTTGLQTKVNMTAGAASDLSAAAGISVSGVAYTVEFDFWGNVNGPFPGGGGNSTEFIGGGVGATDVSAGRTGASLVISGEGGSSYDWRLYKDTGLQYGASGQYDVDSNNNSGVDLSGWFPGNAAPAYQQSNYAQQTGTVYDGSGGFAWHHMVITVDPFALGAGSTADLGIANFAVDGHSIGTIDNSNLGTVVAMEGRPYLDYVDLYAGASDNADLSFGVFDNFVVTEAVPEPGTLALLAMGGLALLRRRC